MNQIDLPLSSKAASSGPEPSARLLSDLFFSRAESAPDSVAAIFGERATTYRQMADQVEAMARGLVAAGVKPGQFVGLWMTRSLDLQIALLAILRAGAAYLPFDQAAPADRVAVCLKDAEAVALVADHTTQELAAGLPLPVLPAGSLARADGTLPDLASERRPEDPAYLIYTSGSTGLPKGVLISHRNICHYLTAAQTLFQLTAEDVVFQGASVAFDLSLEEIFLPYLAGARLWIASQEVLQDTENLAARMAAAGITVLDTVPTLLALLTEDVPTLRVVILGGEACPPALTAKWCRPGRKLFNSYGPTETTVVATAIELKPQDPITIGRALPGYTTYVVDENFRSVTPGAEGELLIGGPGVAQGYWRRPELTAAKFIANPFNTDGIDPVLYRTGDAVAEDEQGRLVFRGRIDDQVKIRGFRVELGEIEARLVEQPDVLQAALVLRRDGEFDQLVAFVKLAPDAKLDPEGWRHSLALTMPPYMVPTHFQAIPDLPTLTSGKLNRKALAQIPLDLPTGSGEADEAPANAIEAVLLEAVKPLLPAQPIRFDADFFLDLGGHSLIAARFVSRVRKTPALAGLTINDVYGVRTLRAMAELLAARGSATAEMPGFEPPPLLRRFLCGLAQAICLPVVLTLTTAPWLAVFVAYQLFTGEEHNFLREVEVLTVIYALLNVGASAVVISAKWLILGRTRPGVYPLWGVYYFRWWLTRQLIDAMHLNWFKGTPVLSLQLRLLGARVGRNVVFSEFDASAADLLEIGDAVTFGSKTLFANVEVIGDKLVIGRIKIGAGAMIGSSCVLGVDSEVGEGAELADLTALSAGTRVGPYETWEGSPARRTGHADTSDDPEPALAGRLHRAIQFCLYALLMGILPAMTLIPIIPAFYIIDSLGDLAGDVLPFGDLVLLPLVAWPAAMALILLTILVITVIRWTVLPRVRVGRYSIHGWFYMRKWAVAAAAELTLETLSPLFATVYMRNWYRLLGARIGRDAEISTNLAGSYDLIDIGEKCFIADEVVIGDEEVRHGWMILKKIHTGSRVFVGNSAVVPPGADIPDGTLIGIKSRPPSDNALMTKDSVWFGSPPLPFPLRQRFDQVAASIWTYEPSAARRTGRAVFEAFSVSFASMLAITFGSRAVDFLAPAMLARNFGLLIPQLIGCATAISVGMTLAACAIKWLLMGVYRPTIKPMWSWWSLRTECVAVNYFGLAGANLLEHLRGTPFLPWVLRLFGCKFGQGVYMDSTDITEFDCIHVGDYSAINSGAVLQTHLYEDRVMKSGRVIVGNGVAIGSGTTVLYDTKIGDYARLGPLTIVMKGEEIPSHSLWQGAPAQSVSAMQHDLST
jgi:non-ribosomal peptide synthetase-like protein